MPIDKNDWDKAKKSIVETKFPDDYPALEQRFAPIARPANCYRARQVEQLLGHIASLLDRCVATRAQYEDKRHKAISLWFELNEFVSVDAIHQEETQAGWYTVDSAQSASERDAAIETVDRAQQFIDMVGTQSAQQNAHANPLGSPGFTTLQEYAQASVNAGTQRSVAEKRLAGLRTKADFDAKNAMFRQRRTEVAREINQEKAIAFTKPGGYLNFPEQIDALVKMFNLDLSSALAAMDSLRIGFARIYDYELDKITKEDPVNSAVLAIRRAAEWLYNFSLADQAFVVPVSVRDLAGAAWAGGLSHADVGGSWIVNVPKELFVGFQYIRLRGIQVSVATANTVPLWSVTVTPPRVSGERRPNAQQPAAQDADSVVVGRIRALGSPIPPDTAGVASLTNVCPICPEPWVPANPDGWKVDVRPASKTGHTGVEDVLIGFVVAARPATLPVPS